MSAPPIPLLPLHQLEPGQVADCYALLITKTQGVTKNGRPYFTCQFRDAHRVVACLQWAESLFLRDCVENWKVGTPYRLRVQYQEHPVYGSQVELHDWRLIKDAEFAAGFDVRSLIPTSRFDPEEMWQQLTGRINNEMQDEGLKRLTLTLLDRWKSALISLPATENRFYPFQSGWLEHTLSLSHSCLLLCDHYLRHYADAGPTLNRDLVLAGAVLHDVGRVVEHLPAAPGLPREPTVPGKLYGHLVLGRDLVRDLAKELDCVDAGQMERLEHLILAHLTLPEWGSVRLPLIPEVLILHHADDLDAKMEMYLRCLRTDVSAGPFTVRDPILNKPLLKPGAWAAARVPVPEPPGSSPA